MLWPYEDVVAQIARFLPAALTSPAAIANIGAITKILPPGMESYYVEHRLAPGMDQVDFSACATTSRRRPTRAANWVPGFVPTCISGGFLGSRAWARIGAFWSKWAEPDSPLARELPLAWLELDRVGAGLSAATAPGVYVALESPRGSGRLGARSCPAAVDLALAEILGQPLSPSARHLLDTCFRELPESGTVRFVGIMPSRQPTELKINGTVPRAALCRYLDRIGWPGAIAALQDRILERYCPSHRFPSLDRARFDLTILSSGRARIEPPGQSEIHPKIGIELFSTHPSPNTASAMRPLGGGPVGDLLQHLVDDGLASPAKRNGVLAWARAAKAPSQLAPAPIHFDRTWHLKLILDHHQNVEAKAYLGFTPGLFPLFGNARSLGPDHPSRPHSGTKPNKGEVTHGSG